MNTNPQAKTILCYGDSNTWGRMPDRTGRFDAAVRWTGKLQTILGDDYYVIEEGLGGRTTNLDDPDSVKNGLTHLLPCLKSHEPLDYVLLMLGTNDFKFKFNRNANEVAESIRELILTTRDTTMAKIVVISPAVINPEAPRFMEFYSEHFDESSGKKSAQLVSHLKNIAQDEGCTFIDAQEMCQYGEDGVHLTRESHQKLATELSQTITRL